VVGAAAVGDAAVGDAAVGEPAVVGAPAVGDAAVGDAAVGEPAVVGAAAVGEAAVGEPAVVGAPDDFGSSGHVTATANGPAPVSAPSTCKKYLTLACSSCVTMMLASGFSLQKLSSCS